MPVPWGACTPPRRPSAAVGVPADVADGEPTPVGEPTPDREPTHWFGKTDGGLGFGPLTWQGRAATFLYVFLVVVAVVTYSKLAVTAFVILFYTVVFVFVLVVKSDLLKHWPPGS